MSILQAQGLAKSYKGRQVVRDLSLALSTGEIVGLLGPNGAGKTTAFYMIIGLIRADGGRVILDDHNLSRAPMHERARRGIGYLPQESSVFRKLSVRDNIMAILQTRRELDRDSREARLDQLLHEFHIDHIAGNMGMSLSGGERRRVEIARALAMEPKFILLDEPFAGVDPISVNDIKQIVRSLRDRGIGVLVTDHNVRDTLDICERAYIVNTGSILAQGTPGELLANQQVREVYLGADFHI